MKTQFFVLRRAHCGTMDLKTGKLDTDIIGITDDEEYAKSQQGVFCYYEKVAFIENPDEKYADTCRWFSCCQGRNFCIHPEYQPENCKCVGVCVHYEESQPKKISSI